VKVSDATETTYEAVQQPVWQEIDKRLQLMCPVEECIMSKKNKFPLIGVLNMT